MTETEQPATTDVYVSIHRETGELDQVYRLTDPDTAELITHHHPGGCWHKNYRLQRATLVWGDEVTT